MEDQNNKIITQKMRESFLKKTDSLDFKYTDADLFMLDLSPYYKEFEYSDNLLSKTLNYNQEKNRMSHNDKISFTDAQLEIFDLIKKEGRHALSAKTSFGKTTLIKELIYQKQPNKVAYIVPTVSLEYELNNDFNNIFSSFSYEIFDTTMDGNNLPNKFIFIGTQEKFVELVKDNENLFFDLFVIDEAYKLSDEIESTRTISLSRVFFDYCKKSKIFILLLPLVGNIIGLDDYEIKFHKTDYSPVAHKFFPNNEDDLLRLSIEKIHSEEKSLLYFNSPTEVDIFYYKNLKSTINDNFKYDKNWVERISEDFHKDWLPLVAYQNGIGIHYGPMPKFIQNKIVREFIKKDNSISSIMSTSSLIEGVNIPTKNIFIYDNNIVGFHNFVKYKNLIGRAGRLGEYKLGNVYFNKILKSKIIELEESVNDQTLTLTILEENALEQINREENSQLLSSFFIKFNINKEKFLQLVNSSSYTLDKILELINNLLKNQYIIEATIERSYFTQQLIF